MKLQSFLALAVVAVATSAFAADRTKVTGDYVEARTASVFAGACHYNGELVTTGRDAVLAWSFAGGSWHGVDLAGVKVVAVVSGDASLGDADAARKCELVIDRAATDAQASAAEGFLRSACGRSLGEVASVRRAAVTFRHEAKSYAVEAAGVAALSVRAMPNDECCKMPNMVWYSPLVTLTNRKVGFTENAAYTAGTLADPWQRSGENGAFYGDFSL